ncbi:type II toxin-antitoxin system Phd/YefM family antitoxin [Microbacterium aurum]
MTVATIGIRELRDGLSRHLAAVQEGDEIVVTDHGKPIARILPYGEEPPLDRLIRLGVARPPRAPRAPLPEPIKANGTVSDLIKAAPLARCSRTSTVPLSCPWSSTSRPPHESELHGTPPTG